jgi:hypothetical protein
MERKKAFQIEDFGNIKFSSLGNEYRHVTLKDLLNNKKIDYVLYNNEHSILWNVILNNTYKRRSFAGEIRSITITDELIKATGKDGDQLKIRIGDEIDLLIWLCDGMDNWSEEERIKESFKKQCWKYVKRFR